MLPKTAVVIMVPIIIPLIATNSTFTFSGRFSTVGFSAEDVTFVAVVVVAVVLEAVMVSLMRTDEDVDSTRGRPVDIAAITFIMIMVDVGSPFTLREMISLE